MRKSKKAPVVTVILLVALLVAIVVVVATTPSLTSEQEAKLAQELQTRHQEWLASEARRKQDEADKEWQESARKVAGVMGYMQIDGICYSVVLPSLTANQVIVSHTMVPCTPEIIEKSKHGKARGEW